jgi:hypothetical protein
VGGVGGGRWAAPGEECQGGGEGGQHQERGAANTRLCGGCPEDVCSRPVCRCFPHPHPRTAHAPRNALTHTYMHAHTHLARALRHAHHAVALLVQHALQVAEQPTLAADGEGHLRDEHRVHHACARVCACVWCVRVCVWCVCCVCCVCCVLCVVLARTAGSGGQEWVSCRGCRTGRRQPARRPWNRPPRALTCPGSAHACPHLTPWRPAWR